MEPHTLTPTKHPPEALSYRRGAWLKTLLRWHWISSALALPALLMFTITGITLNHAADIPASTQVATYQTIVPKAVLAELRSTLSESPSALPRPFQQWLTTEAGIAVGGGQLEWSAGELYVSFPRPGGDAWLSVYLDTGELVYEKTDRGWIAWANDLHKARNTGLWWQGFIDVFAVICLVFCVTGFGVLWLHSKERASIWPVAGLGLLIPVLLVVLTIH